MLNVVVMKFIAPSKLDIPERCNPKIAKSTLGPLWLCIPDRGGYQLCWQSHYTDNYHCTQYYYILFGLYHYLVKKWKKKI